MPGTKGPPMTAITAFLRKTPITRLMDCFTAGGFGDMALDGIDGAPGEVAHEVDGPDDILDPDDGVDCNAPHGEDERDLGRVLRDPGEHRCLECAS